MSVLIVDGWENRRPEGHWQRWLGSWPSVLAWCTDPAVRISAR